MLSKAIRQLGRQRAANSTLAMVSTTGDSGTAYVRSLTCEPLEERAMLAALDDYVAAFDPAYDYTIVNQQVTPLYTSLTVNMVSQTWRAPEEVDRTVWEHWVQIVIPANYSGDSALLLIDGGSNSTNPPSPEQELIEFAVAGGIPVIDLSTVPNQPLRFADEVNRPRTEDEIIGYSFDKWRETGDDTWPVLLPMTKSAVRAMDMAQDVFADLSINLEQFVVTGGSKRGWTTWLTGAVDPRVTAIAPVVFDQLRLDDQFVHQRDVYGVLPPILDPYTEFDIPAYSITTEGQGLLEIVDPYSYQDRMVNMPKYIINATGDEFFPLDSSRQYYDDLQGQKLLRYVPNVGHFNIVIPDVYQSLLVFYQAAVNGITLDPQLTWQIDDETGSSGTIVAHTVTPPTEVRVWHATNPVARDFRLPVLGPAFTRVDLPISPDGTYTYSMPRPVSGASAFLIEFVYGSGPSAFTLSTEVSVLSAEVDTNQSPVAMPDVVYIGLDETISIDVLENDSDPDGMIDRNTIVLRSQPGSGTAVIDLNTRQVIYTPQPGFAGIDSFTYQVRDDRGQLTNLGTVTVHVSAPNSAPVAVDDFATTLEDTPVEIRILDNDSDADDPLVPSSIQIINGPSNGTLSINPETGVVTYTPREGFDGQDIFVYTITDPRGATSNPATVTITVENVNGPPVALDDYIATPANTPVLIPILFNDFDLDGHVDPTSVMIVHGPLNGQVLVDTTNGSLYYQPNLGFVGGEVISYRVRDNEGLLSNSASVYIRVGQAVSLAGSVFVDQNGNGIHDAGEAGIPNVEILLVKTDGIYTFQTTVRTDFQGRYQFVERPGESLLLPVGHYEVHQTHPAAFHDGPDYAGIHGGVSNGQDSITGIHLTGHSDGYRFVERGLRTEFISAYLGRQLFFASNSNGIMDWGVDRALNLSDGPAIFSFDAGIQGRLDTTVNFNPAAGNVNVTLLDNQLRPVAYGTVQGGQVVLRYAADTAEAHFLKIEGNNPSVTIGGRIVTPQNGAPQHDFIGVFNPEIAAYFLRSAHSAGTPDVNPFTYGVGSWIPLVGDWNGDGIDTPGAFDPVHGVFYLRDSNSSGAPDIAVFQYGGSGWLPLVGDWNNDGIDTIGVYNPTTAAFYLRNHNSSGLPDIPVFQFGMPGWSPLAGDWDGDGYDTIGAYNSATATFFFRNSNTTGVADVAAFNYGMPNWKPLVGDWNGDGIDTVGAYNPATSTFHLRNSNSSGVADVASFVYGGAGWIPLAGRWEHSGVPQTAAYSAPLTTTIASTSQITREQLQATLSEAVSRWIAAGVTTADAAWLQAVSIDLKDLPGGTLATATAQTIWVDPTAAGHGWFVDPTLESDEEFELLARSGLVATSPAAQGRMDLLTVVAHELGHTLGLDHADEHGDLMAAALAPGVRRLPSAGAVDRLFAII